MKFDELYRRKGIVALKLKACIRDAGYTKTSFSIKAGIPRLVLDNILDCSIDNKRIFDNYLRVILSNLNMTVDELMLYRSPEIEKVTELSDGVVDIIMKFFSEEPCNYNGMDEFADCEYCSEHCEHHSIRECWENAIKERWYDK